MFSRPTDRNGDDEDECAGSSSRAAKNPLMRLLALLSEDPYRPEKHYMRGPGPKAKAKAAMGAAGPKQTEVDD